jgi:hypothetical protein
MCHSVTTVGLRWPSCVSTIWRSDNEQSLSSSGPSVFARAGSPYPCVRGCRGRNSESPKKGRRGVHRRKWWRGRGSSVQGATLGLGLPWSRSGISGCRPRGISTPGNIAALINHRIWCCPREAGNSRTSTVSSIHFCKMRRRHPGTANWNAPRLRRRFVSLAKKPSTALSQDAEVGVKWKVRRKCCANHSRNLGCLWVAWLSTMAWMALRLVRVSAEPIKLDGPSGAPMCRSALLGKIILCQMQTGLATQVRSHEPAR